MKLTQALLIFLCLICPSQADELGRLFFTPAERLQLAQQVAHDGNSTRKQNTIIVNGLIQRSDGHRIAWINGKIMQNAPGNKTIAVPVVIPGKHKTIEIKIGESLLLDKLGSTQANTDYDPATDD